MNCQKCGKTMMSSAHNCSFPAMEGDPIAELREKLMKADARIAELTTAPDGTTEPPPEPMHLCVEVSPFVAEFIRSAMTNTPVDGVIMQGAHKWYNACAERSREVRKWGHAWRHEAKRLGEFVDSLRRELDAVTIHLQTRKQEAELREDEAVRRAEQAEAERDEAGKRIAELAPLVDAAREFQAASDEWVSAHGCHGEDNVRKAHKRRGEAEVMLFKAARAHGQIAPAKGGVGRE